MEVERPTAMCGQMARRPTRDPSPETVAFCPIMVRWAVVEEEGRVMRMNMMGMAAAIGEVIGMAMTLGTGVPLRISLRMAKRGPGYRIWVQMPISLAGLGPQLFNQHR